jgi:hypothetical protein
MTIRQRLLDGLFTYGGGALLLWCLWMSLNH